MAFGRIGGIILSQMKKLIEKIKAWLKKTFEGVPVPSPEDSGDDAATNPTPQEPSSSFDLFKVKWLGDNFSDAVEDITLLTATITKSQHSFSPAAPASWPIKTVKVPVQGIVCLFYERNDQIVGGKYDWLKPNQKSKNLENVHNGYGGHSMPSRGTKVWTMIVSVDKKKRSNVIGTEWK